MDYLDQIDLDDTKSVNKSAFFILYGTIEELSSELWIKTQLKSMK